MIMRFILRWCNRKTCILLLLIYSVFLIYICVLSRPHSFSEPRLILFSSYKAAWRGNFLFPFAQYNFANILIYVPVGFFASICFTKDNNLQIGSSREEVKKDVFLESLMHPWFLLLAAACAGFMLSSIVEILQLIQCKGTFEVDDFFNNTIGAFIGASWVVMALDRKIAVILKCINLLWIICFLCFFMRTGYLQILYG